MINCSKLHCWTMYIKKLFQWFIMSSDLWLTTVTVYFQRAELLEFVWPFGNSLLTIFPVKLWNNKRLKDAAVSQAMVSAECVISWLPLEHVFLSSALTPYDVDPEEPGLRHKQCNTVLFFLDYASFHAVAQILKAQEQSWFIPVGY